MDYDGDNPTELIDSNSPYFDADNQKHVLTANVKNSIVRLSNYCKELKALVADKADSLTIRNAIAERFDVVGLVDYIVFGLVTSNFDGFKKNWQWLTYDGRKWFVTPYDLDCTFGNMWRGNFLFPANFSYLQSNYKMIGTLSRGAAYWVREYYWKEIEKRYEELRRREVFSKDHIMQYVNELYERIGEENYQKEKEKWSQCKCYSNDGIICNPGWTTEDSWTGFASLPVYDSSATYQEGDKCTFYERIWTATETVKGVRPYLKFGYDDSLDRIEDWISVRLAVEDDCLHYQIQEPESYDLLVPESGMTTVCVPFEFDLPEGICLYRASKLNNDNKLVLSEETIPEADKPYVVIGVPGTYTLLRKSKSPGMQDVVLLSNGLLTGTYSAIYVPKGGYVLKTREDGTAYFALVSKLNNVALYANQAYLDLPEQVDCKAEEVDILWTAREMTCTHVSADMSAKDCIYTISGSRANMLKDGVNIVRCKNGDFRKVLK